MALILVVEDETDIRDDIEDILRFGGHQVIGVANGRLGLDAALTDRPDLILSDINMPEMDGGQFLQAVRAQSTEIANTPFVFLSAYAEREAVIEGKKLGADDYITKPIDHELLIETVNARLRQVRRLDDQKKQELEGLRRSVLDTFPHELRTPLNSVIGFSELLLGDLPGGRLSGPAQEYATLILESGQRLQELVERVLDLVAVTTGKLVPKEREIACGELLEGCVRLHRAVAERRGVVISIEISPAMARLRSDEHFLRRAVGELLTNAVKFTSQGGRVTIVAEVLDGQPTIHVRDTGEGISEEALNRLGSPFFQENSGLARRHEGLGIGFSVARAFVETLGGRIEVQSTIRVGTTAKIRLNPDCLVT